MNQKFCQSCGSLPPHGAHFCPRCGANLAETPVEQFRRGLLGDTPADDVLIDDKKVSELLGLSRSRLKQMRNEVNSLPYFRLGRAIRYSRNAVIAYRDSCMVIQK